MPQKGAYFFAHIGMLVYQTLCNGLLKNTYPRKLLTCKVDSPLCIDDPCQYAGQ